MSPLDGTRRHMVDVETQICATCGSRVAGLCRPLDVAALDEMSSESDQMSLPARSTVFREGDPAGKVFTLMDGTAKLTRLLPDGKQQVVGFRFAGDIIGYTTRDTYPFDAELLTDARLCRLDRSRLLLSLVAARRRRGAVGRLLEMPMTRADIADFLGLTLETVSRTLTSFRKRGWIREPAHQRVELINLGALSALAEGTADSDVA